VAIELSLVVLFGIGVGLLYRYAGLSFSHALVCTMFGFCLASSSLAGPVTEMTQGLVDVIQGRG
jgi:hypothetical protein